MILRQNLRAASDSESRLKIGVSPTPEVLLGLQASTLISELFIR